MVNRMLDRLPASYDDLHPDMRRWEDNARVWGRIEVDRHRDIRDPQLTFTNELPNRGRTDGIVVHHTDNLASVHSVHAAHQSWGWYGIGYNFFIDRDGTIWEGRGMTAIGGHTLSHNSRTIGIALQGRYHDLDQHVPDAQFDSLIFLIRYIKRTYGQLHIYAHRDLNATSCPGMHFPMEEVRLVRYRDPSNLIYWYDWLMAWYYLYIQEATNSHCGDWLELLPPRDWTVWQ